MWIILYGCVREKVFSFLAWLHSTRCRVIGLLLQPIAFIATHTHTLNRTPLDEWSARHRDLYLTIHNIHKRQTVMPQAGYDPAIPASERLQKLTLDRAATGSVKKKCEMRTKLLPECLLGTGHLTDVSIIWISRQNIAWRVLCGTVKWIHLTQETVQSEILCCQCSTFIQGFDGEVWGQETICKAQP